METPRHRPETIAKDVRRAADSASRPTGKVRIALAIGAVLAAAAACGFPPPQDPPADPVPRDEVVGLWENGRGGTIQFRDDGTFMATGSAFGASARFTVPEGGLDGTWTLCKSIYVTMEDGGRHRSPDCVESDEGEYLSIGTTDGVGGDDLLFTGGEQVELYPYAFETLTDSSDYYAKADHGWRIREAAQPICAVGSSRVIDEETRFCYELPEGWAPTGEIGLSAGYSSTIVSRSGASMVRTVNLGSHAGVDSEAMARSLAVGLEDIDLDSSSIRSATGVIDGHIAAVAEFSTSGIRNLVVVVEVDEAFVALEANIPDDDATAAAQVLAVHESLHVYGPRGLSSGPPPSLR